MIDTVTPTWRKTVSRLTHMGWDELHTRVQQEVSKRLDLALYRTGARNGSTRGVRATGPVAPAKFLFSPNEIASRTDLLKEHLPVEAESIVREADEICQHRFRLLGYDPLDYGAEIDWHFDAVHGKRVPLKPWFKIRFLDFDEVGDHKVIWELNRHQHLVTLAKAWCLTGEGKYVTELVKQWYSWQLANPYPMGINWGSSLEVAFRSLSWLWVRALIASCPAVPEAFESDLLSALALNGGYIEKYLSTYFSPNTHLLGEAVALFFIGTLCPQMESAARWRNDGWRIVLQEADHQVRSDGVYFEQSLYYHVYALDFFLHARWLASRNDMEIPGSFDQTLGKMLDVLRVVSQTGSPDSFGDDDGGRVFNPRRNRAQHLTDPLAVGAIMFRDDELKPGANLTEESLWLFGQDAVSSLRKNGGESRPLLKSASFAAGGIYVLASSSQNERQRSDQQMIIDAGPQGTGHSGHGHADALSVRVSLNGRRWLVDPGTFCYMGEERNQFRGTAAHNTLRVDDVDQAVPEGPFAWSSLPTVHTDCWIEGKTFTLFAGNQTGYSRLTDPVLHRRFVFHLHGGFWLVRDVVEGREKHQLETFWHFAPDLDIAKSGNAFVAGPKQFSENGPRLALLPVQDSGWNSELKSGFISPAYGRKEPAPVVVSNTRVQLPAEHASMLVPLLHASDEPGTFVAVDTPSNSSDVRAYRYDGMGKSHLIIFARKEQIWSLGPWTSNARFIYCSLEADRIVHFILCNGSFAKLMTESVFTHPQKVDRLEWAKSAGTRQTFCSDDAAIKAFSAVVLESCDSVF
ncbi:MAG: alginate lyase family protein [Terriglobales bacterium]